MNKLLVAAPLALAALAAVASPASAAGWTSPGEIRSEIAQLDRQIDRLRGLSPREEQRLENQVDRLHALYRSYARGGFSRSELRQLDHRLTAVKARVYAQAHDRNGRFAHNDRDNRFDDHRGHDRHDRR